MILRRRDPRQPSQPPPAILGWRDRYQIFTSVMAVLLGVVVLVRSLSHHAYLGLLAGVALLGWGGVRLHYIRRYFRQRDGHP